MVMKKRVISGWVIDSGSPFSSCSWKIGTTLPLEPRTLPKRTETYGLAGPPGGVRDEHLGDALAGAHDARRQDGLVRGDEDEALDAGGDRGVEEGHRPADVDVDRVRRMLLHHRHVLVGGGVEDDVRAPPVAMSRSMAGRLATLARWARSSPLPWPRERAHLELALDQVEGALGAVHEDEAARAERVDLAGELGADGAAGAR